MGNEGLNIVVAVLSVIMLGVAFYLFSIDRKLNKIEKKIRDKENE